MQLPIAAVATAVLFISSGYALAAEDDLTNTLNSAQCKTEIDALNENSDFMDAMQSLEQACTPDNSGNMLGVTTELDYGCSDVHVDNVQLACTAAGGKAFITPCCMLSVVVPIILYHSQPSFHNSPLYYHKGKLVTIPSRLTITCTQISSGRPLSMAMSNYPG